jgi:hypothetical protein
MRDAGSAEYHEREGDQSGRKQTTTHFFLWGI